MAKMARHSGIPALVKYDGVAFTLRQPHLTTNNDRLVFGGTNAGGGGDVGEGSDVLLDSGFPNDAVVVMALPKHVLAKLPNYEDDECLFRISSEILRFMKPSSYTAVVDVQPWLDGVVLLAPTSIIRCYSLTGEESITGGLGIGAILESKPPSSSPQISSRDPKQNFLKKPSMNMSNFSLQPPSAMSTKEVQFLSTQWVNEYSRQSLGFNNGGSFSSMRSSSSASSNTVKKSDIVRIKSMLDYIEGMRSARKKAASMNLKPLYHFTQSSVLNLILRNGVRMSTQGQGDGGVYFSTLGPASFGIGTPKYEENIIRTCFGVHRMKEYKGLDKLDAVIVYGCCPFALYQVTVCIFCFADNWHRFSF